MTTPAQPLLMRPTALSPRPTRRDCLDAALDAFGPRLAEYLDRAPTDREHRDVRNAWAIHLDEYQMARRLEDAGWESDYQLMELMDGFDSCVLSAHEQALREWVQAHAHLLAEVRPSLEQRVTTPKRWDKGRTSYAPRSGIVTRIDEDRATCTVMIPEFGHVREGPGTLGAVLAWEELRCPSS